MTMMPVDIPDVLWIVGRLLLGLYFAAAGIHHFSAIEPLSQAIAARGVPAARVVLLTGSVFQTVCGVALILGFWPAWAALGLVLFTIVASILFLNFWSMQGTARDGAVGTWKTNLALIGGLLVAAAHSFGQTVA
jgi:putative oxidoreductase